MNFVRVNITACTLISCIVISTLPAAPSQATSSSDRSSAGARGLQVSSGSYYIEFRVAEIGAYGHSYVAYGRLNPRRKPAEVHYADLHPRGNYLIMAVGHLMPVPANTEWDPDVLKLPIASSYYRELSPVEYAKLQAALRRAQSNKQPYWNALTNNCNHFVAELAQAIGLRTPNEFQVSYAFIPALRALNESSGPTRPTPKRLGPTVSRENSFHEPQGS